MANGHALLSPSSASRWMVCTASATATAGISSPSQPSEAAEEGTVAHTLAEVKLRRALGHLSHEAFAIRMGEIKASKYYNRDMEDHTDTYVSIVMEDYAYAQSTDPPAAIDIEARVDFSDSIPGGFGTSDTIIATHEELTVIDFKYGRGIEVSAENNPQMMIYAIGALRAYPNFRGISRVTMKIIQPRMHNYSATTISVEELHRWRDEKLIPAAEKALGGNGEYVPGDTQCRFCRINKSCKARAEQHLKLSQKYADKPVDQLTPEELSEILEQLDDMVRWAEAVKTYALEKAVQGQPIPRFKVVEGRSHRRIADTEAAVQRLRGEGYTEEDYYTVKLKGITALEKEIGRAEFTRILDGIIIKPKGKPVIVPDSDRREPLKLNTIDHEFDYK